MCFVQFFNEVNLAPLTGEKLKFGPNRDQMKNLIEFSNSASHTIAILRILTSSQSMT